MPVRVRCGNHVARGCVVLPRTVSPAEAGVFWSGSRPLQPFVLSLSKDVSERSALDTCFDRLSTNDGVSPINRTL